MTVATHFTSIGTVFTDGWCDGGVRAKKRQLDELGTINTAVVSVVTDGIFDPQDGCLCLTHNH